MKWVCVGGGERMGWRARLGVTLGLSAEHAKCRLLLLRLASSLACWPSRRLPVPLPLRLLPLPFLPCRIMNFSTRVIPAGYDFRFGVQTGPS